MERFSNGTNMRVSQEMDSLMSVMHSQINRAISSAINDRVKLVLQNIMSSLSLCHPDAKSGLSGNGQESKDQANGFKTKITERTLSALDLKDTVNLFPYNYVC